MTKRRKSLVGYMNRFPEWKDMGYTKELYSHIYHPGIFKKGVAGMIKVKITIQEL